MQATSCGEGWTVTPGGGPSLTRGPLQGSGAFPKWLSRPQAWLCPADEQARPGGALLRFHSVLHGLLGKLCGSPEGQQWGNQGVAEKHEKWGHRQEGTEALLVPPSSSRAWVTSLAAPHPPRASPKPAALTSMRVLPKRTHRGRTGIQNQRTRNNKFKFQNFLPIK